MKYSTAKKGTKTINKAGGVAFKETPKLEFVSTLLTTFLKNSYYESEGDVVDRIKELFSGMSDKLFAAKAAVYARDKFGMRSVSHLVAGEIAKNVKGEQWTKNFFNKVVVRPDDMIEILAYYWKFVAKTEPNALKKGFAKAFSRFDAYQLSKYKKDGSDVSLIDVANVVHPFHTKAVEGLIKGKLKPADTWETKMTQAGQKAETQEEKDELKAAVWTELLRERKIGYFALLRNLRNIIEQAPELSDVACELLTDRKLIQNSRVLPFRFMTAMREIKAFDSSKVGRQVIKAIDRALDISTINVPRFEGETLVVLDVSGSMSGQPLEIGSMFSAILAKANDCDVMVFGDDAHYCTYNSSDSVSTLIDGLVKVGRQLSGSTNFHSIFQRATKAYDRIIILSDMQGWVGYNAPTEIFNRYKAAYSANPKVYSFNLSDSGTIQFPEANIFCIAGWSEKIFDVMKLLETDRNALIKEIEAIEF